MATTFTAPRNGASASASANGAAPGNGAQPQGLCAKYTECLTFVLEHAAPIMRQHGVQADAATLAAMTATLFIERNRQGR